MGQYTSTTWQDEILAGSPEYTISGLTGDRTISLATTVTQAGTNVNATNLNKMETGIKKNDYNRIYTLTGSGVVTDHVAFTLNQGGTITSLTENERFPLTINRGSDKSYAITLDGSDDYGTIPATVGELTNGSNAFELVIKFKLDSVTTNQAFIAKTDTGYAAGTSPKGWYLYHSSVGSLILIGTPTNGGTPVNINGSSGFSVGTTYWVKVTFNGTTVELLKSSDGSSYSSVGTSTDSNLITGLSISDSVLTQIGRKWTGSSGYTYYLDGDIFEITLSKSGSPTNEYLFENAGTDANILDTVGTDDGVSAGGAIQGYITDSELSGTPTLQIDSTSALSLQGDLPLVADTKYEVVYNGSNFDIKKSVQDIGNLVATATLSGSSVTISGLDINADGGVLDIVIEGVGSTTADMKMYVNGDTTDANYTYDRFGSGSASLPYIGFMGSESFSIEGSIILANSYPHALTKSFNGASIADGWGWRKEATVTNITSITLAPASGTFTSGTVKIYKRS